jgi:hypothetical protein
VILGVIVGLKVGSIVCVDIGIYKPLLAVQLNSEMFYVAALQLNSQEIMLAQVKES